MKTYLLTFFLLLHFQSKTKLPYYMLAKNMEWFSVTINLQVNDQKFVSDTKQQQIFLKVKGEHFIIFICKA
jgi:formiminotetrahydrofolate cyclodeaminase